MIMNLLKGLFATTPRGLPSSTPAALRRRGPRAWGPHLIALLLIAVNCLAGCKRRSAPVQQVAGTTAATPAPEQYQHPEAGTTPAGDVKYFKGSIGSALGLQMKIAREGERLSGSYFYQKIGTKIDLKGTIDKNGSVTLEEFDSGGKQTGVFKGIWKPEEDGLISIAGNWTKPNSDRKTAFSVHEEPIELSGGVEIAAKQIKEANKKLKYEIDVRYPQLTGSVNPNFDNFNQEVKKLVNRKVSEFKKEMASPETEAPPAESMGSNLGIGYTIALAKDDLISIEFDAGSYYQGAAHPNSNSYVVNFDLKNGKPLKLSDLFKPGSKYLQTISSYCIKDLKMQSKERGTDAMLEYDQIESGAAAHAKNYQSWTITKKGLGIDFDSYQVAPYAAGPQRVLIPYSAVKDIIKPDGPLGQFVK
jgi:hypothetical protein